MKGQVFPLSRSISINPVVHYIIVFLGLQISEKEWEKERVQFDQIFWLLRGKMEIQVTITKLIFYKEEPSLFKCFKYFNESKHVI